MSAVMLSRTDVERTEQFYRRGRNSTESSSETTARSESRYFTVAMCISSSSSSSASNFAMHSFIANAKIIMIQMECLDFITFSASFVNRYRFVSNILQMLF